MTKCAYPLTAYASIQSVNASAIFKFTEVAKKVKIDIEVLKDFNNSTDIYPFHIHEAPVTTDCKSTKLHLDPFHLNPNGNATTYSCKADDFSTCEVGDLSGKFGKLKGTKNKYTYFDASLYPLSQLVDKTAVVIHLSDKAKTRIGCATITKKPAYI